MVVLKRIVATGLFFVVLSCSKVDTPRNNPVDPGASNYAGCVGKELRAPSDNVLGYHNNADFFDIDEWCIHPFSVATTQRLAIRVKSNSNPEYADITLAVQLDGAEGSYVISNIYTLSAELRLDIPEGEHIIGVKGGDVGSYTLSVFPY
jgi:hypothetical protein